MEAGIYCIRSRVKEALLEDRQKMEDHGVPAIKKVARARRCNDGHGHGVDSLGPTCLYPTLSAE